MKKQLLAILAIALANSAHADPSLRTVMNATDQDITVYWYAAPMPMAHFPVDPLSNKGPRIIPGQFATKIKARKTGNIDMHDSVSPCGRVSLSKNIVWEKRVKKGIFGDYDTTVLKDPEKNSNFVLCEGGQACWDGNNWHWSAWGLDLCGLNPRRDAQ